MDTSAPGPSLPSAARSAYALFLDSLADEHEVAVARGAIAGARDADAALLCMAGGAVGDPDPEQRARNFVFDLVPSSVQGVLVLSSAITWAISRDDFRTWLERFRSFPISCLGVPIDGHLSVSVDNVGGIRSVVEHLIAAHGTRRIGFVRGPPGSVEAEDRFRAFRNALTAVGLTVDSRLFFDGDFSKSSGAQAIASLLDEQNMAITSLDAIVAANDYMALGAIEELSRREIQVPEQIAVVGFDDVDSARVSRPTLTTVRQPAEGVGREGIRQLVAMRQGRLPDAGRVLPTELVVRRSCGCSDVGVPMSKGSHLPPGRVETSFAQRRQIILAEVVRTARGSFGGAGSGWDDRMLEALIREVRGDQPGSFGRALIQLLQRIERSDVDAFVMQEVLTALRRQSLPCVAGDPRARDRLEEAIHDARVLAGTLMAQTAARRERMAADNFRAFSKRARAAVFGDVATLSLAARELLPALGIETGIVTAFSTPGDVASETRVMFSFGPGVRSTTGERVSLSGLLAHGILERHGRALLVLPIVAAGKQYGVAVFSVSTIDAELVDELRDLLGMLLGAAALRRELGSRS